MSELTRRDGPFSKEVAHLGALVVMCYYYDSTPYFSLRSSGFWTFTIVAQKACFILPVTHCINLTLKWKRFLKNQKFLGLGVFWCDYSTPMIDPMI